ncbi:DUF4126 domain-containing protein [Rhodococcus ruber]|uniref:DUF4126 domain-containing protein n=1 Tax=Rhodococcus TaxID=1827 RepID=UPI00029A9B5B|nr:MULTISPECIES: DUF4126 domain-containing protein [Rhodococcus]RIK11547.1 MAG: DUF4126 domain-containing protein [Acidobacteriota bacterium]ATQ31139.1 DUF4126 domain-containing protein [Rhodococcus ruber]AXY50935.1 hypothetical protein YT1_1498 [Rhodococcus ruber]MCZ1070640.1 DUF4126 domain-containing protein [Rhodococcus sp. A5(2022)]MDO1477559.1 DUF4126 domain-containing protein [Rhodococcus ruber]
MDTWLLAALLGIGLAAATGLRTFLPLLMLGTAVHFGLFGIALNESMQWVGSTGALVALAIATVVEVGADLVPFVDNVLSAVATVVRPVAGALAAWAAFADLDPAMAALAGIVVGAPTAMAVSTVQTGTRAASTVTTAGLGNPALSLLDDLLSFVTSLIALVVPLLVVPLLAGFVWAVHRGYRRLSRLRTV